MREKIVTEKSEKISEVKEDFIQKEEIVVVEKNKKIKKPKEKKFFFQKFFYGIGKEFRRISWLSKKELVVNFIIVIVIVVVFAAIFTGISIPLVTLI